MRNIKGLFTDFIKDESGLTAVEYAIAGALVAGTLVTAFSDLGDAIGTKVGAMETSIATP